jgi:hypothetical protein
MALFMPSLTWTRFWPVETQPSSERQRLIRLLADEQAKLAALDDQPEKKRRSP